ncbi:MAG TPA: prepilin-type N-terminal cleavage/methylation domain-containing protein [Kineosporiaceae bacterium]
MRNDEPLLTSTVPDLRRPDGGFTLIEMVTAMSVLGIVMLALSSVMFGAVTADRGSSDRLDASQAEEFASTYFADDVQGARPDDDAHPATDGVVTTGTSRCGSSPSVVEFLADAYDSSAVATAKVVIVTYTLETVTGSGQTYQNLHRLSCEASNSAGLTDPPQPTPSFPLTPSSDAVVARRLSAGTTPSVTVSGDTVTLTLTPLAGEPFSLVGQRRAA